MVDDFGPDFDEEGNPLEEGESDRIKAREGGGPDGGAPEAEAAEEREQAAATA
jgi:F-type H+-transporting ATPase subunit alpha